MISRMTFVALAISAGTAFAESNPSKSPSIGPVVINEASPVVINEASPEVEKLQAELNAVRPDGARPLLVDGIKGPMTKHANAQWKKKPK